jgi:hypothetical protein
MKSRARGSLDRPSQKIACLRTSGFRFVRATSMSRGTPSSRGIWVSAKTALLGVSGSDELLERGVGAGIVVQGDRPEGRLPVLLVLLSLESRIADERLEEGDALGGLDAGQPENRQPARVEGAVGRKRPEPSGLPRLEPDEHEDLDASRPVHAIVLPGGVDEARGAVLLFEEAAPRAGARREIVH